MNLPTKKIVVYMDDMDDALTLAEAITAGDERFTLITIKTEQEFDSFMSANTPSAVILDMNLGQNLTGTILASKLRRFHPNLPIAIYTSYEKSRVEKLVKSIETTNSKIFTWQKSEVGVDNLSDEIVKLINS